METVFIWCFFFACVEIEGIRELKRTCLNVLNLSWEYYREERREKGEEEKKGGGLGPASQTRHQGVKRQSSLDFQKVCWCRKPV